MTLEQKRQIETEWNQAVDELNKAQDRCSALVGKRSTMFQRWIAKRKLAAAKLRFETANGLLCKINSSWETTEL